MAVTQNKPQCPEHARLGTFEDALSLLFPSRQLLSFQTLFRILILGTTSLTIPSSFNALNPVFRSLGAHLSCFIILP